MERELQQLQQVFRGSNVFIEKSGIGKVNAALGVQRMIAMHQPDCIISSGCAGGNGDDISIRDVVVSTHLAYHDVYCGQAEGSSLAYGQVQGLPARFPADPYLLEKALGLQRPEVKPGLIVTGDWFVDSREKMQQIVALFPEARAVDMESAAMAHTCHLAGIPFISLRVVSDVPLRDSHASQYHDFWASVAAQSFELTRTFVESL